MIHELKKLSGKVYWNAAISNDGTNAFMCGRSVRVLDCNTQRFIQTVCKTPNACIAISHDQKTVCIGCTSNDDSLIVVECAYDQGTLIEQSRTTVRNCLNSDGGKPCFSVDNKYLFFASHSKKLWRYTCGTGECQCIYQPDYPDQFIKFDVYKDQILISVNSSSSENNHHGYDILNPSGECIKSLRYRNDRPMAHAIRHGKWLNTEEFVGLFSLSAFYSSHDILQKITWKTVDDLVMSSSDIKLERAKASYEELYFSPDCRYVALVLHDFDSKGFPFFITLYSTKDMRKVIELESHGFVTISFSANAQHMFICSDSFYNISLE